jgi:endonuclease III
MTWAALRDEGIMTIKQLSTKADQLHKLPGIGRKTAHLIRDELARTTPLEEQPPHP